jgi:cytochrome c biogenesis protein ResB
VNIALIGVVIAMVAIIGGIVIVRRNPSQQPFQVKVVLFGIYFWGLVFSQLLVLGLGYYWIKP